MNELIVITLGAMLTIAAALGVHRMIEYGKKEGIVKKDED